MTAFWLTCRPTVALLKVTPVGLAVTAHEPGVQPGPVHWVTKADTWPIDSGEVLVSPVVIVAVMNKVGVWTGLKNGAGTWPLNDQSSVFPDPSFGSTVKLVPDT